jgi:hypothetical protein
MGLPVLLVLPVLGVHHWGMDQQLEAQQLDYLTQAQLDRLIADQRLIAESGIFPVPTRQHNAGDLLNPLFPLDGGSGVLQTPVQEVWWSGEEIRDSLRGRTPPGKRGARRPRRPYRWATEPEAMPVGDLSITKALLAYDHWETSTPGGRYAEYLFTGEFPFLASSPIPNLVDTQTLARLRLVQGLTSPDGSDMLAALEETRHLARLAHSTETLVASMLAGAILSIEKRGYDVAVERGLIAVEDWVPADDELRYAIRRAGFGMVMVVSGWTVPDDAHKQLVATGLPLFNLCGGLNEAVFQFHLLFPAWSGLPLERDLSHFGDTLQRHLAASTECRMVVGRDVLAHPERMDTRSWKQSIQVLQRNARNEGLDLDLLDVPFLRGHLILYLTQKAGTVQMFRQYGATADRDFRGGRPGR